MNTRGLFTLAALLAISTFGGVTHYATTGMVSAVAVVMFAMSATLLIGHCIETKMFYRSKPEPEIEMPNVVPFPEVKNQNKAPPGFYAVPALPVKASIDGYTVGPGNDGYCVMIKVTSGNGGTTSTLHLSHEGAVQLVNAISVYLGDDD